MGNAQSSGMQMGPLPDYPREFENILKDYQKREKVKDDRFDVVTVYNLAHSPTELMIVKDKWTHSAGDATELNSFVQTRSQNAHKGLAKLIHYGVQQRSQGCSDFWHHFMAFEYFPKNMEQEIEERIALPNDSKQKRVYSEPEIWYTIDLLVSILHSFENRGYHHGDIQPKNLMIDPHGFIKLTDNSLINYGETGYTKAIFRGYKSALSPKLMAALPYKELKPVHDPSKSDVYSIGITALCASLNRNIGNFYDWSKPAINYEAIKSGLVNMAQLGFSKQLINVIEGMLNPNEDSRTSCQTLFNFMETNGHAIRSGEFHRIGRGSAMNSSQTPMNQSIVINLGNQRTSVPVQGTGPAPYQPSPAVSPYQSPQQNPYRQYQQTPYQSPQQPQQPYQQQPQQQQPQRQPPQPYYPAQTQPSYPQQPRSQSPLLNSPLQQPSAQFQSNQPYNPSTRRF